MNRFRAKNIKLLKYKIQKLANRIMEQLIYDKGLYSLLCRVVLFLLINNFVYIVLENAVALKEYVESL